VHGTQKQHFSAAGLGRDDDEQAGSCGLVKARRIDWHTQGKGASRCCCEQQNAANKTAATPPHGKLKGVDREKAHRDGAASRMLSKTVAEGCSRQGKKI